MNRSRVAVLRTKPENVHDDYKRLLRLADTRSHLPATAETALKINISWHFFYPACSTTPWQLEGVIQALLDEGFDRDKIYGCHTRTVVVSAQFHRPLCRCN